MKKSIISSLILFFCAILPLSASIRYVPDDYPTIQGAIDDCNYGDTIIVKPGTYTENINFHGKNITVTSTNPEDSNIVATTIIDGDNAGSVVTFVNGETNEAIFSGFTVIHGSGQISAMFSSYYCGAGIYCYNASPTIKNNVISNNYATINVNDDAISLGGGISCLESNAIVTRNIIKNNIAYFGGGVMSYFGNPVISNNIIRDNAAIEGGGGFIYGGYYLNNTFSGNSATITLDGSTQTGEAGNMYIYFELVSEISNNIICNATSGGGIYYSSGSSSSSYASQFRYNNVWGNQSQNYYSSTDLTGKYGNISQNPKFGANYHIGTDSPCYNAGDPNFIPYLWQEDIDGQFAVMGSRIDIGADEVLGNARPVADAGNIQHFYTYVSNVTLNGLNSYDQDNSGALSYHWTQVSGPNVVISNPDSPEPNFAPPIEDTYVFALTVFDGDLYSQPDTVMIIVGNRRPVAEAGNKQVCEPDVMITLNGRNSYDLDEGDQLTYRWTQVSGPAITFSDPNNPVQYFIPTVRGEYVFALVVSDGSSQSYPDMVTIICRIGSEPDAYGYSWIDNNSKWGPAFNWIDITSSRTKITNLKNALEKSFGPYALGFNFNFYGKTYNSFYIQADGLLSFGSAAITYSNQTIPNSDGYDNIIAWLWSLLYPLTDSVIYYKSYSDHYVIQFYNYTTYYNDGVVNAEVILYKSGKIVIQFKDFTEGSYTSSYTIGIENSDGTVGTQVAYNDYDYLRDKLVIEFSRNGPYEPVAHAGSDQEHKTPVLITLNGTGSVDRDPNDVLTYQWSQASGPAVTLSDPNSAVTTFTPAAEGEYIFRLVVSDGTSISVPDEVSVFIGNRIPVANAGVNKICEPNQFTSLDGSGSYDPDKNDALSYTWTQVSGPTVNLSNAHSRYSYFEPTMRGEYIFELVVSDGLVQSQPDTVTVLCGMGSFPDEFGYHWMDNNASAGPQPKFNWIDIQETGTEVKNITSTSQSSFGPFPMGFQFSFYGNTYDKFYIQSNGLITFNSTPVTYNNTTIPTADTYNNLIALFWAYLYPQSGAKLFYQHFDGYTVVQFVNYNIDYGGSFNAEVIMYASGKIVFQYKDFSSNAYLYQYTIGIENANGTIGSQVSYCNRSYLHNELVVELTSGAFLPVADAGENQHFSRPSTVTLDGSKSFTYALAGITSYQWTQVEGPAVTLNDANTAHPTFISEPESQYRFQLVVGDGTYQSQPDEVLIVVHNFAPVAYAGSDQYTKVIPDRVTLNGSASYDPLQEPIFYRWKQLAGPAVVLSDANAAEPSFVPVEYGYYEFELTVSDGLLDSIPDIVKVVLDNNFFPVADAGLPVYTDGRSVSLNGKGSYDPDHSPGELIYSWVQKSGPVAQISGADTANPVISGISQTGALRICEFELVVFDGQYFSFPDTVELKVIPTHPASILAQVNGPFDPNKPTIIYFDGGNCTTSNGSWWFSNAWIEKANAFCFNHYEPDSSSGSRLYNHCGDMLILFLSQAAPNYNQAIQTIGFSTGCQPAMDSALRLNMTYKDARYAVNRVTLFDDGYCRNFAQDTIKFMENPVDGEQNWIDVYSPTTSVFYPGAMAAKVSDGDNGIPPNWYNDSITNTQKNQYNGGIVGGWYWSIIGPGKNLQLSRSRIHEQIYRYLWTGSTITGSLGFYNQSQYPAKMLEPVNLNEPYGNEDSNGVILSSGVCENAVGYEILIGTDPNRVMDFEVIRDSNEPYGVVTSLPAETSWWTIKARDEYGSTIFADPKPITSFMMTLPVQNLTTSIKYTTLQDAVDKAASGDEILVSPGIYPENVIFNDKNIIIRSINGEGI